MPVNSLDNHGIKRLCRMSPRCYAREIIWHNRYLFHLTPGPYFGVGVKWPN